MLDIDQDLLEKIQAELRKAKVPADDAIDLVRILDFFQARDEYSLYCLLYDYMGQKPYARELRQPEVQRYRSDKPFDGKEVFVKKYQRQLEKVLLRYPDLLKRYEGRSNMRHAAPVYRLMQA